MTDWSAQADEAAREDREHWAWMIEQMGKEQEGEWRFAEYRGNM